MHRLYAALVVIGCCQTASALELTVDHCTAINAYFNASNLASNTLKGLDDLLIERRDETSDAQLAAVPPDLQPSKPLPAEMARQDAEAERWSDALEDSRTAQSSVSQANTAILPLYLECNRLLRSATRAPSNSFR